MRHIRPVYPALWWLDRKIESSRPAWGHLGITYLTNLQADKETYSVCHEDYDTEFHPLNEVNLCYWGRM